MTPCRRAWRLISSDSAGSKPTLLLYRDRHINSGLSAVAALYNAVLDLLALLKLEQFGPFERVQVHEDVFRSVFRLNKTVAFIRIKPLYVSNSH